MDPLNKIKFGFWSLILIILIFLPAFHGFLYDGPIPPECGDKVTRNSIDEEIPQNCSHRLQHEKIAKALWDAKDYKLMSMIVRRSLHIVTHNCNPFLFKKEYDKFPMTMFIPQDKAVRFEDWIRFDYQIVFGSVLPEDDYRESGNNGRSWLDTCEGSPEGLGTGLPLFVTQVSNTDGRIISLNNIKIKHWNIYKDSHIIVHGVEDFFETREKEIIRCYSTKI